jgi:hypothetical protein
MESQELFDPATISAAIGGAMVVVAVLLGRLVGWLKALIVASPTKIDDRAYNSLVKAFTDAGVISADQAAKVSVDNPKPGGVKLQ